MNNVSDPGRFYDPSDANLPMGQIVAAYGTAFAGPPWFEVSKCADPARPNACTGGLSPLNVGETCNACNLSPSAPAYLASELADRFSSISSSWRSAWYVEQVKGRLALAAFAWRAPTLVVAGDKYPDVPAMASWLSRVCGDQVVWLDEVFADRTVRPSGNLDNFVSMCQNFVVALGNRATNIAFRTKSPAMVRAARRFGGRRSKVYRSAKGEVPDRRDFVRINTEAQR